MTVTYYRIYRLPHGQVMLNPFYTVLGAVIDVQHRGLGARTDLFDQDQALVAKR